jgi:hypothetical protein
MFVWCIFLLDGIGGRLQPPLQQPCLCAALLQMGVACDV